MNNNTGIVVGIIVVIVVIAGALYFFMPAPTGAPAYGTATTTGDGTAGTVVNTTTTTTNTTSQAVVGLNNTQPILDTTITPTSVVTDSRCPTDVQCIQAGTVTVKAMVGGTSYTFTLGTPVMVGTRSITLSAVSPDQKSKVTIVPGDYMFTFTGMAGQ